MDKEKLTKFAEFYLESSIESSYDEDTEMISKELEEAGIDAAASERKALDLIRQAKAEAKIERGKRLKQSYNELLNNIDSFLPLLEKEDPELAVAFRKLQESPDNDELLDDKEKIKLLEYLRKTKNL